MSCGTGHLRHSKRADLRAALEQLAALGATDVAVAQKKRVCLTWRLGGRPMAISMAVSPRDVSQSAVLARRMIRRCAGLAAPDRA